MRILALVGRPWELPLRDCRRVQVRAMPCWQAYGPARWGKRSSYGNGFGNFSRYITEPRDFASETSRLTPDFRLFALIWAIISPWKRISEPSSFATVKYRKFSSIPLPYSKKQGNASGHRRAIERQARACPMKKPNPKINQRFPKTRTPRQRSGRCSCRWARRSGARSRWSA